MTQKTYAEGVADERARWETWCADLRLYYSGGKMVVEDNAPAALVDLAKWLRTRDTMWEDNEDWTGWK